MTPFEKIALLMLIALTLLATLYAAELFLLFSFILNRIQKKGKPNKFLSKPAILAHILTVITLVCLIYSFFVEPYWVEIHNVRIETKKLKAAGLRVVQISDLHCDKKIVNEKKLPLLINPLKPDIIVFTGDSLNSPEGLNIFKDTLKSLKATIGKFAVRGNFDAMQWNHLDLFSGTGFELLDDKSVLLRKNGESFRISGLGAKQDSIPQTLLKDIPSDCYSIFLYHLPDLAESLAGTNIDLYLAGHTHGGQINLPFYGAIITFSKLGKKYESGLYKIGDKILYVNRGLGLEAGFAPKARFLARPEITVFDIEPEKK